MKIAIGFTLIELLITITISAMLAFVGLLVSRDIMKNQLLKKVDKEMRIGISQAKDDAFFGKKPMNSAAPADTSYCIGFLGNLFTINAADFSYTITAKCTSGAVPGNAQVMVKRKLSSGVALSISGITPVTPNVYQFMFNSINRTTDLGNQTVVITLSVDASRLSIINVLPSGEIQ